MGMFDYIKTKMPLPLEPAPPNGIEWFQTKEVPGVLYLEKWVIEADGRLVKCGVRYEDRSNKNAPEGSLERICGMMTAIPAPEDDKVMDFHGDIGFGHYDSKTGEDWDYVARFTDGRCTKIWIEEYSPPSTHAE